MLEEIIKRHPIILGLVPIVGCTLGAGLFFDYANKIPQEQTNSFLCSDPPQTKDSGLTKENIFGGLFGFYTSTLMVGLILHGSVGISGHSYDPNEVY